MKEVVRYGWVQWGKSERKLQKRGGEACCGGFAFMWWNPLSENIHFKCETKWLHKLKWYSATQWPVWQQHHSVGRSSRFIESMDKGDLSIMAAFGETGPKFNELWFLCNTNSKAACSVFMSRWIWVMICVKMTEGQSLCCVYAEGVCFYFWLVALKKFERVRDRDREWKSEKE